MVFMGTKIKKVCIGRVASPGVRVLATNKRSRMSNKTCDFSAIYAGPVILNKQVRYLKTFTEILNNFFTPYNSNYFLKGLTYKHCFKLVTA